MPFSERVQVSDLIASDRGSPTERLRFPLIAPWTARRERLSLPIMKRHRQEALLVGDAFGGLLIAVLFILVVLSLAILPWNGVMPPRIPAQRSQKRFRFRQFAARLNRSAG